MGDDNVALMISDLIGQVAQLELMVKYGIKPNAEFCVAIHDKYYKDATPPTAEKMEAQVAINTQRDIELETLKPKPKPVIKTKHFEPKEEPKHGFFDFLKRKTKHKLDGYSHDYRR